MTAFLPTCFCPLCRPLRESVVLREDSLEVVTPDWSGDLAPHVSCNADPSDLGQWARSRRWKMGVSGIRKRGVCVGPPEWRGPLIDILTHQCGGSLGGGTQQECVTGPAPY
ncbi:hypothetical protein SKAU_G00171140 [Synaphobranchus kaupii]|uniref:Uncharacterized protein n=1 Tax=Synaphobranchus kaupii TaxID=118154 RepID=A0A9Q1FKF7_SYNKA|nr:hypothetical protein SKAU_G00171140 [Synaphobranchus kaupii]